MNWDVIKKTVRSIWYDFEDRFNKKPMTYLTNASILLFCSLVLTAYMFIAPPKIRALEVDSLIYRNIHSDKLLPLDYLHADKVIQESEAISIMFSVPKGKQYNQALSMLSDEQVTTDLNRRIQYYPLVYGTEKLKDQYNISVDEVTFVFFQKGKELNRFTLNELKDIDEEFIPELNRLPMWRINDSETDKAQK